MASVWSLTAMILWGILLGFCYQIFWKQTEKRRSLWGMILFCLFAGALCFLLTALFLCAVSGGKWGIYGFLSMVFGFFLYLQWFRPAGNAVSVGADRVVSRSGGALRFLRRKTPEVLSRPFEKIVDKGEKWIVKKEQKRKLKKESKKQKEEDPH